MNRTLTPTRCALLVGLMALLMFQCPPAAAASLHCNVTQLPNGTFRFQLSEPPSCSSCSSCTMSWEDTNSTVISRDSTFNESLVERITDQYIDLKICHDHLHYTRDCGTHLVEADCRVNCSHFAHKDRPPLWFCVHKTLCFPSSTGGLLICGLIVAVVLVLGVIWGVYTCRRRRSAATYKPPTEQIRMDGCQFFKDGKENALGADGSQTFKSLP